MGSNAGAGEDVLQVSGSFVGGTKSQERLRSCTTKGECVHVAEPTSTHLHVHMETSGCNTNTILHFLSIAGPCESTFHAHSFNDFCIGFGGPLTEPFFPP